MDSRPEKPSFRTDWPRQSPLESYEETVQTGFQWLLKGLLTWIVLESAIAVPFFFVRKLAALVLGCTLGITYLVDLHLLRKGRFKAASWLFLIATWLASFVVVVLRGGLGSQYLIFLLATSIAAGWLLGVRSMLLFSAIALISTLILAILQTLGFEAPNYFSGRHPIGMWLFFAFSLIVAVIPLKYILESLRDSVFALRSSEVRYRALVHSIDGIVWEADAESLAFTFVSQSAERILGYPLLQWSDDPDFWQDHLVDEDRDRVLHLCGAAGQALGDFEFQCRMIAADARIVWMHVKVQVIVDPGCAPKLRGIMMDISRHAQAEVERQRAEEALRQSEKELLQAQRVAQVGSWLWDPQTDTVVWSLELYRIAGRDPNLPPPTYQEQAQLYTSDSWERMQRRVAETLRSGTPYQLDLEMIRPDGTTRWIIDRGEALRDDRGRIVRLHGTAQDITERKRAEDSLRLFRALIDQSNDAIEVVDPDSLHFLDVNERACTDLGYSREELLSMTVADIDPNAKNIKLAHGEELRKSGFLLTESIHRRKDGSTFPVEVGVRIIQLDRRYCVAVVRDITARKQAEEDLRSLSGRLINSQDEERRRIARELHETTAQDLAALRMSVGRIKRVTPKSFGATHEAIEESLDLSNQVIASIRTLAYVLHPPLLEEAGLQSAVNWYASGFSKRSGIRVEVDLPDDVGRLPREYETTFFRIMQECLTNVHNHSGSSRAYIRIARCNGVATMEVKDDGKGIPDWSNANLSSSVQIGVGIAGMRERVKQFHGTLEVDSEPGKGTTVRVRLPITKATPDEKQA